MDIYVSAALTTYSLRGAIWCDSSLNYTEVSTHRPLACVCMYIGSTKKNKNSLGASSHACPRQVVVRTKRSGALLRPVLLQDYFGTISGTISSTTNSTKIVPETSEKNGVFGGGFRYYFGTICGTSLIGVLKRPPNFF